MTAEDENRRDEPEAADERLPAGPIAHSERSLAPDLARGAVLLFIALANVVGYLYGHTSTAGYRPDDGTSLDRGLDFLVSLLIDQRSYPMFAMLFGYGMWQLVHRQEAKGASWPRARRLLVRRNLWLLAFGAVHAALLFGGDILGPYAVTSLLALLFFHRSARVLAIWSAVSVVTLSLAFGLIATSTVGEVATDTPDYVSEAVDRLVSWGIGLVVIVLLLALLGPVLIGVLLGRAGWLDRPWEHVAVLRRVAVGCVAGGVLAGLPYALLVARVWEADGGVATYVLDVLHAAGGVAVGLAYVCGFALFAAWH